MSRLRDNQALRDEVRALVAASWNSADDDANSGLILDAVDRALTATGPGSGPRGTPVGPKETACTRCGFPLSPCHRGPCEPWCGGTEQVDASWWDGATSRHFCSRACLERSSAPQTDHRAAPGRDDGNGECRFCLGRPHPSSEPCKPATPPSGSPPAVTEPTPGAPLAKPPWGTNVTVTNGLPPYRVASTVPAATPGEPVTSGSPPGAAPRCVNCDDDGFVVFAGVTSRCACASPPESPDGSRGTL